VFLLYARNIRKEIFPVYSEKRKAFYNWIDKFSQGRSKVANDDRPCRRVDVATEAHAASIHNEKRNNNTDI
jgi:hypothetical protein